MSWSAMSDLTASFSSGVGAGDPNVVDTASSSSIDAFSYFFSVNPSPSASAFTSYALMRSTSRSKNSRTRGSVLAPELDSSSTLIDRLNSCFAASKWPCSSSFCPALKWRSESAISFNTGSSTGLGACGSASGTETGELI